MVQFKVLISLLLALELFGIHNPVLAQKASNKKMIIVIDPGHGGKDSGAVGVNGILEKDIVLKIAKEIVDLNETTFKNRFEIYLTRYKDTLISLGDRTKLAKSLNADIFISLHCNYSDNPNARGLEVYVSKKQGKYSKESVLLAYDLQNGLKENIGFESRGVKFGDFQVIRETTDYSPAVLLELCFLSHRGEVQHLTEEENLFALGLSIFNWFTN
ncbi:N-acetylmuramoyl-L-alanine amidase family protein [Gelidibacter japonicus]|uniref:N-acetylmuramoyl-L-alanine amidase family protein n=1 Tax=Gelidibacter japonicus TaxID=1962232 RepID=UPI003A93E47E